jgi:hypothetical protein
MKLAGVRPPTTTRKSPALMLPADSVIAWHK